ERRRRLPGPRDGDTVGPRGAVLAERGVRGAGRPGRSGRKKGGPLPGAGRRSGGPRRDELRGGPRPRGRVGGGGGAAGAGLGAGEAAPAAGLRTGTREGVRPPVSRASSASSGRTCVILASMRAWSIIRDISRFWWGSTRVTTLPDSPALAVRPPRCR